MSFIKRSWQSYDTLRPPMMIRERFWARFGRHLWKKQVLFKASAISFNIFILLIPFSLILFSIMGYIFTHEEAKVGMGHYFAYITTTYNHMYQGYAIWVMFSIWTQLSESLKNRNRTHIFGYRITKNLLIWACSEELKITKSRSFARLSI